MATITPTGIQGTGSIVPNSPAPVTATPVTSAAPTTQTPAPTQPAQTTQPSAAIPMGDGTATGYVAQPVLSPIQALNSAPPPPDLSQYGSKTPSPSQVSDLSAKYQDLYKKVQEYAKEAPATNPMRSQEMIAMANQSAPTTKEDAQKTFIDNYQAMNPFVKQMFDNMQNTINSLATRQSFEAKVQEQMAASGIQGMKTELMDIKALMRGQKDAIAAEIQAGGGFATAQQIRAITDARNSVLLEQAAVLTDQINGAQDYVDMIMKYSTLDRQEVEKQVERQLGLDQMKMQYAMDMENAARDAFQQHITEVGYDGFVNSLSSAQELEQAAAALGVSPSMLVKLSKVQTTAQKQSELQMLNYQLSVDKFENDKYQFGLNYALEQQRLAQTNAANKVGSSGTSGIYAMERSRRSVDMINKIIPDIKGNVGTASFFKGWMPESSQYDFRASVEGLKSAIAETELVEMREASKTGGALGNTSDRDLSLLQNALGNLDTYQSEKAFTENIQTVLNTIYHWNAVKNTFAAGGDLSSYNTAVKALQSQTPGLTTSQADALLYQYFLNQ